MNGSLESTRPRCRCVSSLSFLLQPPMYKYGAYWWEVQCPTDWYRLVSKGRFINNINRVPSSHLMSCTSRSTTPFFGAHWPINLTTSYNRSPQLLTSVLIIIVSNNSIANHSARAHKLFKSISSPPHLVVVISIFTSSSLLRPNSNFNPSSQNHLSTFN